MTVRLELHADDPAGRWRALADVSEGNQYGGYGATPLEAMTELAHTLTKVVGYERAQATP